MEGYACRRTGKQPWLSVYSAYQLRVLLRDRHPALRLLGQQQRSLVVCQHGVRLGCNDVPVAHLQQNFLQTDRQRVGRSNHLLPDLHHDDNFGVGVLHSSVLSFARRAEVA